MVEFDKDKHHEVLMSLRRQLQELNEDIKLQEKEVDFYKQKESECLKVFMMIGKLATDANDLINKDPSYIEILKQDPEFDFDKTILTYNEMVKVNKTYLKFSNKHLNKMLETKHDLVMTYECYSDLLTRLGYSSIVEEVNNIDWNKEVEAYVSIKKEEAKELNESLTYQKLGEVK